MPSLALLIHLAEGDGEAVGIKPLEKALGWARYLESHARRIFAVAVGDDIQGAKSLADKLREGALRDGFAVREVYRHGWSGLTNTRMPKKPSECCATSTGFVRRRTARPRGSALKLIQKSR